jgi:hypothetical protein
VRWVNGFAERHGELHLAGPLSWSSAQKSVTLTAADGATAVLEPFVPRDGSGPADTRGPGRPGELKGLGEPGELKELGGIEGLGEPGELKEVGGIEGLGEPGEPGEPEGIEGLAGWAAPPTAVALILVRRGGYAVGVGQGPELIAHKVGTRYVQSRTAAGGWSQQRFARRRANQADALVGSVIEHTRRVVLASPTQALVVGGDKALVRDVLTDPRLAGLAGLPRRELFDLPDPKLIVLKQALRRARAVRIALSEPGVVVVES